MRTKRLCEILVGGLLVVLLLVSCGGGGGGGGGSSSVISLKTSTIRSESIGDYWHWSGTGTLNDGSTTINLTGTMSTQILSTMKQSPINFTNCLVEYSVLTLSGPGGSVSGDDYSYFLQDANGAIYEYGRKELGQDVWVVSPSIGYFLSTASPMGVGQSNSGIAWYNDDSKITYSYTVTSKENVSTSLGTYESYKLSISFTFEYFWGDSVVVSKNIWYVPGLGTLKVVANETLYSGGIFQYALDYTASLDDTNVIY